LVENDTKKFKGIDNQTLTIVQSENIEHSDIFKNHHNSLQNNANKKVKRASI